MLSNQTTAQWRERDAAHHWHPQSDMGELNAAGSRIITRAEGVYIYDNDGNQILDGMAGLWCVMVGYGRKEIAEAVAKQMNELPYYNLFFQCSHPPAVELAEKIASLTPPGMSKVFFTGSGSESNDTALRLVRTYWAVRGKPEKTVIIGRRNGYHGSTLAGVTLGGMKAMHEQGGPLVPDITHIDQPYWFDEGGDLSPEEFGLKAARALEAEIDRIGEGRVAAFIAEPIQGAGGVVIPPSTYWPEVKRILKEREILFIADEVICGFGRTGEWWGSTSFDLQPDVMCMAKGLTSGYLPMGAVAVADRVSEVMYEKGGEFTHGFTYSGHPACCAAALANIAIIEREDLVGKAKRELAPYLKEKWSALADHPVVGDASTFGLLGKLELTPNKKTRARFAKPGRIGGWTRNRSVANGLVMRAVRDSMILSPPLSITKSEIDEIVQKAGKTLDELHRHVKETGEM